MCSLSNSTSKLAQAIVLALTCIIVIGEISAASTLKIPSVSTPAASSTLSPSSLPPTATTIPPPSHSISFAYSYFVSYSRDAWDRNSKARIGIP
jgi:hypothetical protein